MKKTGLLLPAIVLLSASAAQADLNQDLGVDIEHPKHWDWHPASDDCNAYKLDVAIVNSTEAFLNQLQCVGHSKDKPTQKLWFDCQDLPDVKAGDKVQVLFEKRLVGCSTCAIYECAEISIGLKILD